MATAEQVVDKEEKPTTIQIDVQCPNCDQEHLVIVDRTAVRMWAIQMGIK
jgi:Zn finger protein HypA/HybF involved in hydrogenase expression